MHLPALPTHATLLHPRTGMPLQAVGLLPNGRIIWPIMGGDGTEPDANQPPETPPGAGGDPADPPPPPDAAAWESLFAGMTPEDVKAALDNSRRWEQRAKANGSKYEGLVKRFGQAIQGQDGEGPTDDTDPTALTADLTAAQQEARQVRIENAVLKAAATHNGNPARLVDSLSFMSTIRTLDPSAADFGAQVEGAIKRAVENDDYFKASTGPRPQPQQGTYSEGRTGSVAAVMEARRQERAEKAKTN